MSSLGLSLVFFVCRCQDLSPGLSPEFLPGPCSVFILWEIYLDLSKMFSLGLFLICSPGLSLDFSGLEGSLGFCEAHLKKVTNPSHLFLGSWGALCQQPFMAPWDSSSFF